MQKGTKSAICNAVILFLLAGGILNFSYLFWRNPIKKENKILSWIRSYPENIFPRQITIKDYTISFGGSGEYSSIEDWKAGDYTFREYWKNLIVSIKKDSTNITIEDKTADGLERNTLDNIFFLGTEIHRLLCDTADDPIHERISINGEFVRYKDLPLKNRKKISFLYKWTIDTIYSIIKEEVNQYKTKKKEEARIKAQEERKRAEAQKEQEKFLKNKQKEELKKKKDSLSNIIDKF